ncbi:uncharacterized protein [Amphiura filiformis]|uniref:uncharacterized protein n=1 Tax=Amphiura filiformis TaxID=82378 RepID=UPI003B21D39C
MVVIFEVNSTNAISENSLLQNDTVLLTCTSTGGVPLSLLRWEIVNNGESDVIVSSIKATRASITIVANYAVTRLDNGAYFRCVRTHVLRQESETCDPSGSVGGQKTPLLILYPPALQFEPESITITKKTSTVTVKCLYEAIPSLNIGPTIRYVPQTSGETLNFTYIGGQTDVIDLHLTAKDAGKKLQCSASNEIGNSRIEVEILGDQTEVEEIPILVISIASGVLLLIIIAGLIFGCVCCCDRNVQSTDIETSSNRRDGPFNPVYSGTVYSSRDHLVSRESNGIPNHNRALPPSDRNSPQSLRRGARTLPRNYRPNRGRGSSINSNSRVRGAKTLPRRLASETNIARSSSMRGGLGTQGDRGPRDHTETNQAGSTFFRTRGGSMTQGDRERMHSDTNHSRSTNMRGGIRSQENRELRQPTETNHSRSASTRVRSQGDRELSGSTGMNHSRPTSTRIRSQGDREPRGSAGPNHSNMRGGISTHDDRDFSALYARPSREGSRQNSRRVSSETNPSSSPNERDERELSGSTGASHSRSANQVRGTRAQSGAQSNNWELRGPTGPNHARPANTRGGISSHGEDISALYARPSREGSRQNSRRVSTDTNLSSSPNERETRNLQEYPMEY